MAQRADFVFGDSASHRASSLHRYPGTMANGGFHAGAHIERFDRQKRQTLVRKTHRLQSAKRFGAVGQAIGLDSFLLGDDFLEPLQKPRVEFRNRVDFRNAHTLAKRLCRDQQPVRRRAAQFGGQLVLRRAFQRIDIIKARKPRLKPAQRLLQAFMDIAANRHHLAD